MKILYLPVKRKNTDLDINLKELNKLPKEIIIAYSIQYKELAEKIKQILSKQGSHIIAIKQVLGCTKLPKHMLKNTILLVSDGKFHALNLSSQINSPIYIYTAGKITKIDKQEIEKIHQRKKAKLTKFLLSDNIGLLVSTKPGQNQLQQAKKLKKQLQIKKKNAFIFLENNFNLNELENFPIDIYINTACLGLAYDSPKILNLEDLSTIKY